MSASPASRPPASKVKVENGKLVEFIKDWNKLSMWEQFGWPLEECLTQGR